MKALHSWPNHLPRPHLQISSYWDWVSAWLLGAHKCSVYSTHASACKASLDLSLGPIPDTLLRWCQQDGPGPVTISGWHSYCAMPSSGWPAAASELLSSGNSSAVLAMFSSSSFFWAVKHSAEGGYHPGDMWAVKEEITSLPDQDTSQRLASVTLGPLPWGRDEAQGRAVYGRANFPTLSKPWGGLAAS